MLVFSPIQSTLDSFPREFMFDGIVGIVNRYFISVVKTSFRGIAFLLLNILDSVFRTESFKLSSQLPKRYLNKVLIIRASNINFTFYTWVVANYQLPYLIFDAVINYQPSTLVQIVSDTVIAPLIESSLFVSKRFYSLLIFLGLKLSKAIVVPLVNALDLLMVWLSRE